MDELLANGIRVFLIYPVPVIGWDVPYRRYKMHIRGIDEPISIDAETHFERHAEVIEVFDDMDHELLTKIDPFEVFCDSFLDGRCVAELDGKLLYRDDDHLTNAGSEMLLGEVMSRMTNL